MFPKMARATRLEKSLLWRKFLGGISVGVHHGNRFFFKRKVEKTQRAHTSFHSSFHVHCIPCTSQMKSESSLQARVKHMQILHFSPQHSHVAKT